MVTVELDQRVYFPELGAVRDAVVADDLDFVEAYIERWRVDDPHRVHLAAWTVAETSGADAVLRSQRRSRLARTLIAILRIKEGWDIRTARRAQEVSAEQWAGFRDKLVAAERDLMELAAEDPSDALVAATRLTSARGLGLGLSESQRRYARLSAVSPDHIAGQASHLQSLAPKWFGSTDLMFTFARDSVRRRPGTSAGRLVAIAHHEHWLDLPEAESGRYVGAEAVQDELAAAADSSVFHPDYEPGLRWVADHSYFASLHSMGGRNDLARRHFEALGSAADLDAWKYFDDPAAELERDRTAALGRGSAP